MSAATPACSSRGRRGVTASIFSVTLDLAEGRTVTLHFPASRTRKHHAELMQAFSRLPRGRDWLVAVPCPDDYRELFSRP